ncbi:MAG: hypothetical protein WCI20_12785, partial [bacterium]
GIEPLILFMHHEAVSLKEELLLLLLRVLFESEDMEVSTALSQLLTQPCQASSLIWTGEIYLGRMMIVVVYAASGIQKSSKPLDFLAPNSNCAN